MTYIPFFLHIAPQDRIVLIGGGNIALAKAESLRTAGASLYVVAESILPTLRNLVQGIGGTCIENTYAKHHLEDAKLVIAATDDNALNAQIHADAKELNIIVNVVDTPELCDFIFPAIVERGNIKIAISTEGVSPTLARLLKRKIEQLLPGNLSELGKWISHKRAAVQQKLGTIQARRMFWEELLEGGIVPEVLEGNAHKADALFTQALENAPIHSRGALWLIGAGPGHPELITVRAIQLIGQADVILYDRLVSPELLTRYARKEAKKIPVGKSRNFHAKRQEEIDGLLEEHLRKNRIVVRLKGGDPSIYAHAAEEIAVAAKLGVPWQIVPGVTAALGCAATAGIPLTERGGAAGVRFLTLYDEQLHDLNFWHSLALNPNETLVFYMTTKARELICSQLMIAGLKPETPILAIEQGTTPYHAEYEATLADFGEKYGQYPFITPTLMIIGNVVRWRTLHGWKEPPKDRVPYFPSAESMANGSH